MNDPMFSMLNKKKGNGFGNDPLNGSDSFFDDLKKQQQQRQVQANPFPASRINQNANIQRQPQRRTVVNNYYNRPSKSSKGIVQTLQKNRPKQFRSNQVVSSIANRFSTKGKIEQAKAKIKQLNEKKELSEVEHNLAKQRMEDEQIKDRQRTLNSQVGVRGKVNRFKESLKNRFVPRKSIYA